MEEKRFTVDYSMSRQDMKNLSQLNELVQSYIEAGEPVRVILPYGTFKGSTVRLKIGKRKPQDLAKIFRKPDKSWGDHMNDKLIWDLEAKGSNRTFHVNWSKVPGGYGNKNPCTIILGGDGSTEIVKHEKNKTQTLVDFMGKQIEAGDYVLMYNSPFDREQTGTPFRMLRYTGKRSPKQAQFTYVKLAEKMGRYAMSGGETIRVGLNVAKADEHTDIIYGVKVDVDESLATAMQLTDHDMSLYPVKFHIGMED